MIYNLKIGNNNAKLYRLESFYKYMSTIIIKKKRFQV